MTDKQKLAFAKRHVSALKKRLHIDSNLSISVHVAKEDKESSSDVQPHYLELEEEVVTRLEMAIMGKAAYDRVEKILRRCRFGGTLAAVDCEEIQYFRASIYIYPQLMQFDEDEFKLVSSSKLLHEMLHLAVFPLASYARSLESK